MREQLLHFIWQHQHFKNMGLVTTDGELLEVQKPGFLNEDAGPDFTEGRIKIGDVSWLGDIEIHIKSSHWAAHGHQNNMAYNKVILHVVWAYNKPAYRQDGTLIPTLELAPLVPASFIAKTEQLLNTLEAVACGSQLALVKPVLVAQEIERKLVARLQRKATAVLQVLNHTKGDWAETTYRLLMRQMGMKVNSYPFEILAKKLPYATLKKYVGKPLQMEALLFGMAGLLPSMASHPHEDQLINEFNYLAAKHKLSPALEVHQWKFLRLRPANFPTLRLAQAAALLATNTSLFEAFTSFSRPNELTQFLGAQASSYWATHYRFGKPARKTPASLGQTSRHLILLNVAAPLLAAYSLYVANSAYMHKAIEVMQSLPAEQNKITKRWKEMGVLSESGAQSQGLIELFNEHCQTKKCLTCGIGYAILNT